nr:hypothetical protein Iba_chr13fCG8320 [Ipomoea batatas]
MGGSTFNQIDEIENVSVDAEGNEGPMRTPTSTEEIGTSGQGKSPRVVLSALLPHFSPHTVEHIASTLPQEGLPPYLRADEQIESTRRRETLPAPGEASSSTPQPAESDPLIPELKIPRKKMVLLSSDSVQQQEFLLTRTERTRVLTDAASKISLEVYDYFIFRTPEDYKKANLEPPDYSREGKYELKTIATTATATGSSQGMVMDTGFISAPHAPRPPRGKVVLRAKKAAAAKGTSDPSRL